MSGIIQYPSIAYQFLFTTESSTSGYVGCAVDFSSAIDVCQQKEIKNALFPKPCFFSKVGQINTINPRSGFIFVFIYTHLFYIVMVNANIKNLCKRYNLK